MTIKILSPLVANQIAAGEVVERPASIVKELVENSLDAGATNIEIRIEQGGCKRILIIDNGSGIDKQQLTLALSRHATSKISESTDLESIESLGFRGEALASISAVSRLTLSSYPAEQESGWQAIAEGRDMEVRVEPASIPNGTRVEVLDLFFNTPARRRFLKSEKTEYGHIEELYKRFALSRFDVKWQLLHNGKRLKSYNRADNPTSQLKRVGQVMGSAFAEQAHAIEVSYDNMRLTGWLGSPYLQSTTTDKQHFFVNGRVIKDRLIQHAIRQGFANLLQDKHYPCYVLYLSLPANDVDVNVHPAKHEVRFQHARTVHDFIAKVVAESIQQPDHQPAPQPELNHQYKTPLAPVRPSVATASTVSRPQQTTNHYANWVAEAPADQAPVQAPSQSQILGVVQRHLLCWRDSQLSAIAIEHVIAMYLQSFYADGEVPIAQPLLLPVSVKLSDSEAQALTKQQSALENMGFVSKVRPNQLILTKVPAFLRQADWSTGLPLLIELCSAQENINYHQLSQQIAKILVNDVTRKWPVWAAKLEQQLVMSEIIKASQPLPIHQWLAQWLPETPDD